MNKIREFECLIREEEGVFILFLTTIAVPKERKKEESEAKAFGHLQVD